jgi:hypothetical protein
MALTESRTAFSNSVLWMAGGSVFLPDVLNDSICGCFFLANVRKNRIPPPEKQFFVEMKKKNG